jgi:hypothetical protein
MPCPLFPQDRSVDGREEKKVGERDVSSREMHGRVQIQEATLIIQFVLYEMTYEMSHN